MSLNLSSEFFTSNEFASFSHCYCGENCVSNCVGIPTFKGIILFLSVVVIISFIVGIVSYVNENSRYIEKTAQEMTE